VSTRDDQGPDSRAQKIAGLRQLADALAANPDMPLPYFGSSQPLPWYLLDDKDAAATVVRALPCAWKKDVDDIGLRLAATVGGPDGLKVEVVVKRDAVCTRRVVGTEIKKVTKVITPAVMEEVEEPAEIIERICEPILKSTEPETRPDDATAVTAASDGAA
jgi:hypothetical protein